MSNYQQPPTATDECPVCYEPYGDIIRIFTPISCVHSICIDCYQHCDACPNCRMSYPNSSSDDDTYVHAHNRLPNRPARATRSEQVGDSAYQRIMQRKRHISALIHMFRQFVSGMRRAETANGTHLHAQYLVIGTTMMQSIVDQEHVLQTQMLSPGDLNLRRTCYYQNVQFNLLDLPELNLHEALMRRGLMASAYEIAAMEAVVPLPELPAHQYPLSLRRSRALSNANHVREVLDRLHEAFRTEPELPAVFISM